MTLAVAVRAPRPDQRPRTHAVAEAGGAACGTPLAAPVDGVDLDLVTCQACRVVLHRAGLLPYVRTPRGASR